MKQLLMTVALATIAATDISAQPANLDALLTRMSLDEKIGQMVQLDLMTVTVPNSSPIKLDKQKLREAVITHGVGSFINNGLGHALSVDEWHYVNKTIQDMIRAETPNKIPLLYGIDSMHGATYVLDSTLFPQEIAMAATRNPGLVRRASEISAAETRAAGLRWTFAPVLDVGRQPLWARLPETYGEDPYLTSVLGVASVQGFQGAAFKLRVGDLVIVAFESDAQERIPPHEERIKPDGAITLPLIGSVSAAGKTAAELQRVIRDLYVPDYYKRLEVVVNRPNGLANPTAVAACLKHYLGYSFPLTGKDRSPALMPDWYLREYFLPPFREAVKAGAKTVMLNSGEVNGMPVHGSKYLLTDVLRGELGFQGVIVSDWEDVIRLHTWHKVADSPAEAVRQAVEAGLDISMVPLDYSFGTLLKQLVKEGKVSEQRINESVRRILQLKADVGLFTNPYVEPEATEQFGKPEYRQVALTAAEEAVTLLKNERDTLPLAKSGKVLVTGPAAKSISALHGCWSFTWQGKDEKWYPKGSLTILDAIKEKLGETNVLYHQGVDFDGKMIDATAAAADAARADAVVLCLGEEAYAETPGDINDLDLPAGQIELAKQLYAAGKPVVLVLVEGRPRVIREIEPDARGILMAYWPGSGGAQAIANVLFGDINPSGKLPFTYPRHANNLLTYDRKYTSLVAEISAPGDTQINQASPQWEFGQGLSYTTFALKNLQLSAPVLKGNDRLGVTVDVLNTGQRTGKEVIELYTSDLYASLTPPLRRLRAFTKVELRPGEKKSVKFELSAADLAFVNLQSQVVTEPGEFEVIVGDLKAKFGFEQ